MKPILQKLENSIDKTVKSLPFQLPANVKKSIVQYTPLITLVVGIISLLASLALWRSARYIDRLVDYTNNISSLYKVDTPDVNHLGIVTWLGIITLAIMGILYLIAYSKLKNHSKAGWNLLYYGLLFNLVSGIVLIFDDYNGGLGSLIKSLFSSAIGFYFLFQIRSYYVKDKN